MPPGPPIVAEIQVGRHTVYSNRTQEVAHNREDIGHKAGGAFVLRIW